MIKLKVGDSEVCIWQDPYGVTAKIQLFSYASEELISFVTMTPIVQVSDGHEVSEAELARILELYLENLADSALMMAAELRKRI